VTHGSGIEAKSLGKVVLAIPLLEEKTVSN
jgi:hypothetical protein